MRSGCDCSELSFCVRDEQGMLAQQLLDAVRGGREYNARNSSNTGFSANRDESCELKPLMIAASVGNTSMMQMLIEEGADVNASSPCQIECEENRELPIGSRALHFAVQCRQFVNIPLLLEAGSDPNASDTDGTTPLMVICVSQASYR